MVKDLVNAGIRHETERRKTAVRENALHAARETVLTALLLNHPQLKNLDSATVLEYLKNGLLDNEMVQVSIPKLKMGQDGGADFGAGGPMGQAFKVCTHTRKEQNMSVSYHCSLKNQHH